MNIIPDINHDMKPIDVTNKKQVAGAIFYKAKNYTLVLIFVFLLLAIFKLFGVIK